MNIENRLENWRSIARQALEVHDKLLNAWRALDDRELRDLSSAEDTEVLKQMIVRRIYPVNAFAALAVVDRQGAIDVLFSRYLGIGVDPDSKFGGYCFELSTMLDDLRESYGEAVLRELICDRRFNRNLLHDKRVLEAFMEALEIDHEGLTSWFQER